MHEEFVPMYREDSTQEQGLDHEDTEEEMDEDKPDFCDTSNWGSLPDLCLRHVFTFLRDPDRSSADLVCHHWHNVMRSPSLWRYRVFHFTGRLSKFRHSEYCTAVTYARSLGAYLERLEVSVYPPRRSSAAQRLEQAISSLFSELTRARAPLRYLSIVSLELDRSVWNLELRNSLINSLILLIRSGTTKLSTVCLRWMQIGLPQGLELLAALSNSQRCSSCYISSLDLEGFFSSSAYVHLNFNVPLILRELQGLTELSLSYSYVSDELLNALQYNHRVGRQNAIRDGSRLQKLSLYCNLHEHHQQLVCGDSWAALASSCPDLQVKFTVHQVIDNDCLARILLREIPVTEYSMMAFYLPDENWSAKPFLRNLLPQYRRSLKYLTLDLNNCSEPLDRELLELVKVCNRLEKLTVWAFLEVSTVEMLLQIILTTGTLLNKIKVKIYSINDDTDEQEDQLEKMLSSYQHLPPELKFSVSIYPYA